MLNRWNFLKTGFYEGIMSDQPVDQSFVRESWEDPDHARDYIDAVTTVGLWESERTLMDRYVPRNGAVLDIGCGAGRTTVGLYEAGDRRPGECQEHEEVKR